MRVLTLVLAVLPLGLACSGGDRSDPPESTSGFEQTERAHSVSRCFADGRHLGVESAARDFFTRSGTRGIIGYEVGATHVVPEEPGARFEMEYVVHWPNGARIPVLFVALVDAQTCIPQLVTVDGRPYSDWESAWESRDNAPPPPPSGEHCVDAADRHLGFERLARDAVAALLARDGASINDLLMSDATIRPANEWHPYEARVTVFYDDADGRYAGTRDFYAEGAIHTETCDARLDSVR